MKTIKLIWNDIKHGENIDLFATVLLAFGLAIVSLFGVSTSTWVPSLTLAVLGLLAISNLVNRYRIDVMLKKSSETTETLFLEEFSSEQQTSDFDNASELWLVGIALTQTMRKQHSRIERLLKKGTKIKVLLVHPKGPALKIAVARSYRHTTEKQTRNEILDTITTLCDLRRVAPKNLEIRTIENPLGHAIFAINPTTASGVLYIAHFTFKMPGTSRPKYVLRAKDSKWYDFYRDELCTLWENGVEWQQEK
jgi:hypothetical protein